MLLSVSLLPHTTYTFSSDVAMTAGRAFDGFDGYPIAFWSSIAVVPIIARAIIAIPHTTRYCFMTF
jgi:hypothetical protein